MRRGSTHKVVLFRAGQLQRTDCVDVNQVHVGSELVHNFIIERARNSE